jgi:hypothetical protein
MSAARRPTMTRMRQAHAFALALLLSACHTSSPPTAGDDV